MPTIFKPRHEEPEARDAYGYILLPYGMFYEPTMGFEKAKRGDILRFFNGPEYPIYAVRKIKQDTICDLLCQMAYGCPWRIAFEKWLRYAKLEGYGAEILSKEECFLVIYEKVQDSDKVR